MRKREAQWEGDRTHFSAGFVTDEGAQFKNSRSFPKKGDFYVAIK